MRFAYLAFACFVGCHGGPTSPVGPVGTVVDLRGDLKPEVLKKAPTDGTAMKRQVTVDVHGIAAKIVWRTFEDGPNQYILSYQWEVVTPSPGITLEPLDHLNPINLGDENAVVEAQTVRVRWHDNAASGTSLGEQAFRIDAAGREMPI